MKALIVSILLCLCAPVIGFAGDPDVDFYRGELKGSKILIASPGKWNKKLLILAHGHRAEKEVLHADFPYDSMFFTTLLNEGWIIASTSYRRNGIIIEEAISDLNDLREFTIGKYGKPDKIYMKGSSMGGIISLLIAENLPDRADGILNECNPAPTQVAFTHKPKIPTLFFTNQDEAPPVREYLENLAEGAVKPGLWVIQRDGHCNMNDDETLLAFREMIALSENRPIQIFREFIIDKSDRESAAIFKDDRAHAKVTGFSPAYGNIYTEFVMSDLSRLGINKGDMFALGFGKKEFPIKLGATYSDVSKGEWVAFFEADGFLKVARNFANAAEELGCKEGSTISIRR